MKGDFYYTGLAVYIDDALFPFLSATNGSKRSQRARARDCCKNIPLHGDRSNSYLCQLYLSLDSRAFLDTVSLHYNELSPFLGKFRFSTRPCARSRLNRKPGNISIHLNQRLSSKFHESAEFNQIARELYGTRSM